MDREGLENGSGRFRRALTVLVLSLITAACYAYTDVSLAAVPPGSDVRLQVDEDVQLHVGEIPLRPGRPVFGKLLEANSPDTLLCSVRLNEGDPLNPSPGLRVTVSIPVAALERLEVRHFQKSRTAALVGAGAMGAFSIVDWAFNVTSRNEGPGDGPSDVENARMVLFRWRW